MFINKLNHNTYSFLFFLGLLTADYSFAEHGVSSYHFSADRAGLVSHQMDVQLDPDEHFIQVIDEVTLDTISHKEVIFSLHPDLSPESLTENVQIKIFKSQDDDQLKTYKVELPAGIRTFKLIYHGKIYKALEDKGQELSRGFRSTSGIISSEGVYLAGSTNWYPEFIGQKGVIFDLNIELPEGWTAISQGKRLQPVRMNSQSDKKSRVRWQESHNQEEIYLIAARFKEYSQQTNGIIAQVFLRSPDEVLANKYLDATTRYLEMYQTLLGPYPYSKFALVENFWETGYGMPSFTLLGSKVIRLPFIINSSYPHEILHNWWGNGVYVNYSSGNWSEGLTSYLADHLIKEQQGQGVAYRQQSLQKYTDYAAGGRDFPLSEFQGRHDSVTEAVGYGKALMFFHMLRLELGDEVFIKGLQDYYKLFLFHEASYEDWHELFEMVSKKPLTLFFKQWVKRTGAPELLLDQSKVTKVQDEYLLTFELVQRQKEPAYQLIIPIAVTLDNHQQAFQSQLLMTEKRQKFEIKLSAKPLRLDIDPEFDLFRKLAIEETPPAFTQVFGSKQLLVVLPRNTTHEWRKAYENFARSMKKMGTEKVTIKWDHEINQLPENYAVTLLGWENTFLNHFKTAAKDYELQFGQDELKLNNKSLSYADNSLALTIRRNNQYKTPLSFIATDTIDALPGLARKLPHYHKYSYVVFSGSEPSNHTKGQWSVRLSPMTKLFLANTPQGTLKKRLALTEKLSLFSAYSMLDTINYMAGDALKGRGFGSQGLNEAAAYIAKALEKSGLLPGGDDGTFFQSWKEKGGEAGQEFELKNVVAIIPGTNPAYAKESVVIGAHYDHLGLGWPDVRQGNKGQIHNGADDNASGVAVLLELAKVYGKKFKPERTVILVAFSGEEAGRKGSKYYLKHQKKYPAEQITGMLNLDTVGRLDDKKLLVLGAGSATEWPHIFRGIGFVTGIQTILVKEDLDASDQISFHEAGVPAVQLFSGVNLDYHRPTDTVDKIDPKGLIQVAVVSKEVIEYLASRETPMTSTLDTGINKFVGQKVQRKVSLGTIPDFTWSGKGYRLDGVVPGSPADAAALQKDDVIVKIDEHLITNLKDISMVLKALRAGQTINIEYSRNNSIHSTKATLTSK